MSHQAFYKAPDLREGDLSYHYRLPGGLDRELRLTGDCLLFIYDGYVTEFRDRRRPCDFNNAVKYWSKE